MLAPRTDPDTWGVDEQQLELPANDDVASGRQGRRRRDAFSVLAGTLTRHQRDAADRLIVDLAELYGVAGSFGLASRAAERIVGSPAHTLMSERKILARQRLEDAWGKIGIADKILLTAIAEPIVLGAVSYDWRETVRRATGDSLASCGARVRAALENLRLAYGLGEPARLHPFEQRDPRELVGAQGMAVSASTGAVCAPLDSSPPPTSRAPGIQSRGPVLSGGPELEAIGRYVLQRVLLFTQVSEAQFQTPGKGPSGAVGYARALAAYLMHVELGLTQADCARILPLTQQAVSAAVERIEELREDPALDTAIDILAESVRRRFAAPVAANDN